MAEEAREERWADFRRALRRHWQKDFGTGRRFDVFREMELEPDGGNSFCARCL